MSKALVAQEDTDRRTNERVSVALFGRCLLPNTLEIPCQAIDISPGDVAVVVGQTPNIGDDIIMYLDHVGRLQGKVARIFAGGFAMELEGSIRHREKLAARIEWLQSNTEFNMEVSRRHERMSPRDSNSEIKLDDGRTYPVEIVDISLSGAAVNVEVKPAIGTNLSLAGMQGQVVRHFSDGIALEFVTAVPIKKFERTL